MCENRAPRDLFRSRGGELCFVPGRARLSNSVRFFREGMQPHDSMDMRYVRCDAAAASDAGRSAVRTGVMRDAFTGEGRRVPGAFRLRADDCRGVAPLGKHGMGHSLAGTFFQRGTYGPWELRKAGIESPAPAERRGMRCASALRGSRPALPPGAVSPGRLRRSPSALAHVRKDTI